MDRELKQRVLARPGCLKSVSDLSQAEQLQSCFKSRVDMCVPKGLSASGCKQERGWAPQHLLREVFSTPESQNCTVVLWTGISVYLSYQETTGKGKGDKYSGSASAVFTARL